jgi:hypothetical protein
MVVAGHKMVEYETNLEEMVVAGHKMVEYETNLEEMVVAGAKMAEYQTKLSKSLTEDLVVELHEPSPVFPYKYCSNFSRKRSFIN